MSVPAFRNSKSKVRRRRSHHALKAIVIAKCEKCKADILSHRVCTSCGYYKGRNVIGSDAKVAKTLDKATKAKKPAAKKAEVKKVEEKVEKKAKSAKAKKVTK